MMKINSKGQAFKTAIGKYGRWQEKESLLNSAKSQELDTNLACNQGEIHSLWEKHLTHM